MTIESTIKVLKDARFNEKETRRYELAVSISSKKCSAVIFDSFENRFVCLIETSIDEYLSLAEHKKEVEAFLSHSLFSTEYKSVTIIYVTFKSTLVPEAIFEKELATKFLSFNHALDFDDVVEYSFIRNGLVYCLFAVPRWLKECVSDRFKTARFNHQTTSLIDSILMINKNKTSKKKLYVNVQKDFFDVILIDGDNLVLSNSFCYLNSKDFMYFLMNIYEQLKLNPEINELTFMGQIDYDSDLLIQAKLFVKNINFVSYRDELQRFSYVFDDVSLVHYVSLLNLFACV
jgi:hypothetical protein